MFQEKSAQKFQPWWYIGLTFRIHKRIARLDTLRGRRKPPKLPAPQTPKAIGLIRPLYFLHVVLKFKNMWLYRNLSVYWDFLFHYS